MVSVEYGILRMLIVEDEQYTRQIIRALVQQIGVRNIYEASDGQSAMTELLRIRPHLVLCDVHMQPVGGLEFLKMVRTCGMVEVADTPIVLLTADAKTDTVLHAKEHAVSGYLVKPVSATQLKLRIDAICGGKAL